MTGSEVDDEESKYEIEVTLDNGDQVDVQLDEGFNVVARRRRPDADRLIRSRHNQRHGQRTGRRLTSSCLPSGEVRSPGRRAGCVR